MSLPPTLISFITSDNITYLLDHSFFSLHSKFVKDLELDTVKFNAISSDTFKYIVKYLENRKINPNPVQLPKPLPISQFQSLVHEIDYDLIVEINQEGAERFQEIIRACSYLQIEYFKKILLAGLAYKYLNKNPCEIREYYGLEKLGINEQAEYKQKLKDVLQHINPQNNVEEQEVQDVQEQPQP